MMKDYRDALLLFLAMACLTVPAMGQGPPDDVFHGDQDPERGPPPRHDGIRPHHQGEGPPPGRMHQKRGGGEHLDQLMGHLRENDPEAFEELQRLREEDPRAFRRHLKGRRDNLRREQFMTSLREFPDLHEAFEKMTPEERERLGDQLRNGIEGRRRRMENRPDPVVQELERKLRGLAQAYTEAPEESRGAAKAEIRETLEKMFDAREVQRSNQVKQAEKRLEKLKSALESRTANRDQIIERRVLELTEGDPLAWGN